MGGTASRRRTLLAAVAVTAACTTLAALPATAGAADCAQVPEAGSVACAYRGVKLSVSPRRIGGRSTISVGFTTRDNLKPGYVYEAEISFSADSGNDCLTVGTHRKSRRVARRAVTFRFRPSDVSGDSLDRWCAGGFAVKLSIVRDSPCADVDPADIGTLCPSDPGYQQVVGRAALRVR